MNLQKILLLILLAVSVVAAQERFGNQIFRIPDGWLRSEITGATVLSPNAEAKNMVVIVLTGRDFTGDFREAFDRDVKAINGSMRVVKASEVQPRNAGEVNFLEVGMEVQDGRSHSFRRFIAANVKGRYELLTYIAVNPALYQRYLPAVQQFVANWSFANLKTSTEAVPTEAAPAAATGPKRLEGVYLGYKFNMVNVLGAVQRRAVNDYFSFFTDGTVFWGLPQTGLVGFNMNRACQGRVEFCGTYQVNGEHVAIVLNRGTYRQDAVFTPAGFQIADRSYTLQGDIAKSAAHVLEGDFVRADARPGEDLARHFIRFTRNGQFIDQGLVTTVVSSDISTGSPRFERPGGSGTYTLGPYTIILHYSDGYQRQLGVTIEPSDMDKPALSKIIVNTYTLVRRN